MVKKKVTHKRKLKAHSKIPQPQKSLKAKPFWLAIFILLFISVIAVINSQTSVTGQAIARQNIAYQRGDSSLFVEVRNIQGLSTIDAQFSKPIKNSYLLVEQTEKQKQNGIYNSFIVSSPDRASFKSLVLTLKIKETDLKSLGIKPEQLLVQNNENILTPILQKKVGGYVYYKLTSTRMGTFVLTK